MRAVWTHRMWNMAREHASGFLRDELGTGHPTYRAFRALRPWPKEARQRGRPYTVAEARAIAERLGGIVGRMWWTLCTTGMRNAEYWGGGWTVGPGHVTIPTAKKRGKPRAVPLIAQPVQATVGERWFRRRLGLVGEAGIYDARRTYARWMEEAGIIKTNRDAYMGHGPRTVSDLYPSGVLPGQLAADAVKLRHYIGPNPDLLVVVA